MRRLQSHHECTNILSNVGKEELMNEQHINGSHFGKEFGTCNSNPVPRDIIEVPVHIDEMVENYGNLLFEEARKRSPLLVDRVDLTLGEIISYCEFLVYMRVQLIHDVCSDFRLLESFYIPAYLQHCLSMIGEISLAEYGLTLMPVLDHDMEVISFDEALQISIKLGLLVNDLCLVRDAMPKAVYGHMDVMTIALVADYLGSLTTTDHVAASYAAAFVSMKLKQEVAFAASYRVHHDDMECDVHDFV